MKVIIDSKIRILNPSNEDRIRLRYELTFDNPKYAQAIRYSRYSYTKVPPHITYFEESSDELSIPLGADFSITENMNIEDNRVYNPLQNFPEFVLELRDSQKEASECFLESCEKDFINKGAIQMPTGKGKSILGMYLAYKLKAKTLVVVHKDDLVKGWVKDVKLAFNNKIDVGIIKAKKRVIGDFITVATIQTLNRLSAEELDNLYNTFSFIIQDEMHHCPANSFSIVSNFKARYRLGLTATPERSDGLTHVMKLYFKDFCYRYKKSAEDNDILDVDVYIRNIKEIIYDPLCELINGSYKLIPIDVDEPFKKSENEYQKPISHISYDLRPKIPYSVVDDFVVKSLIPYVCDDILREYNDGHSCLVFLTLKEHCRLFYTYLRLIVGDDNVVIYNGDNSVKENDRILEKASSNRKLITLTTYAKATEGTNVNQWEVEFLVSSINNAKNVEQAVGRVRRTMKNGEKLSRAKVYDYRTPNVYSFANHGKTRDKRYYDMGCNVIGNKVRMF